MAKNVVVEAFKSEGFEVGQSGGGCEWMTRPWGQGDGYLALTDEGGVDYPTAWDTPAMLGFYADGEDEGKIFRASTAEIYWLIVTYGPWIFPYDGNPR